MDVTPTPTPPAKRTRAKTTESAPKTPKVTVKAAKKTAAPSTKKTEPQIEVLKVPSRIAESVQPSVQLSANELRALIATAAYYRAAERNFSAGHEMEDWLAAEREILAKVV